ncbi:MAG: hypothetical protein Kow00124_20220 [Anaerolineae bacterium]
MKNLSSGRFQIIAGVVLIGLGIYNLVIADYLDAGVWTSLGAALVLFQAQMGEDGRLHYARTWRNILAWVFTGMAAVFVLLGFADLFGVTL